MKIIIVMILLLAGCASPSGNNNVPQPKQAVDIEKYLGKWYEVARYENWFEKGCAAPSANYLRRDAEIINITNSCIKDGKTDTAEGKAKIVANSNNSKLKITFFGPFYLGDYWILEHAADYSWSIVGEPSGRYLWILTRVANPKAELMQELLGRVKNMGYNTDMLIFPKHNN